MDSREAEVLVESCEKVCTSYMVNEESKIKFGLVVTVRIVSICDGIFNMSKNHTYTCTVLEEHV